MRTVKQLVTGLAGLALLGVLQGGCATPPRTGYVPAEEEGVMTVGLDDHDYDLIAEGLSKEFIARGLPKDYVVALGPVDTSDNPYQVQIRTIQKKLMVIFNKEGSLKFMAAVDAISGGSSATEIYKVIEYNYFNKNPFDQEDLAKFGKLANVNGILFGRISSLTRKLPGGGTEVTYTSVWELANTQTGVLDVSWEKKIRKNVR